MCCILYRLRARHAEACQRDAGFHRRRELKALQEYAQTNEMRRPYDLEEDMPPTSCKQRLSRLVSRIRRRRETNTDPTTPWPSLASPETRSEPEKASENEDTSRPPVEGEHVARRIMLDELEEHFALHQEGTPEQWALYNDLIRIEESLSFLHDHQTHVVPRKGVERSQERRNGRAALPKFVKTGAAKPQEWEQYAEEDFMMSGAIVWKQSFRKASVVSVENRSSDECDEKATLEGVTKAE